MKPLTPAAKRKIQTARQIINDLEPETLTLQAQIKTLQGKLEQNQNEIDRARRHIWEAANPGKRYPHTQPRDTFEPNLGFTIKFDGGSAEPASYQEMPCREAMTA